MITQAEARLIVCGLIRNAWFDKNVSRVAPNTHTVRVMLYKWPNARGIEVMGVDVPDWFGFDLPSDEVFNAFIPEGKYGTSGTLEIYLDTPNVW
jgi:hypothetical protein